MLLQTEEVLDAPAPPLFGRRALAVLALLLGLAAASAAAATWTSPAAWEAAHARSAPASMAISDSLEQDKSGEVQLWMNHGSQSCSGCQCDCNWMISNNGCGNPDGTCCFSCCCGAVSYDEHYYSTYSEPSWWQRNWQQCLFLFLAVVLIGVSVFFCTKSMKSRPVAEPPAPTKTDASRTCGCL